MNIAILSRGATLYSTQSLLKAGEARNHRMEILDFLKKSATWRDCSVLNMFSFIQNRMTSSLQVLAKVGKSTILDAWSVSTRVAP